MHQHPKMKTKKTQRDLTQTTDDACKAGLLAKVSSSPIMNLFSVPK